MKTRFVGALLAVGLAAGCSSPESPLPNPTIPTEAPAPEVSVTATPDLVLDTPTEIPSVALPAVPPAVGRLTVNTARLQWSNTIVHYTDSDGNSLGKRDFGASASAEVVDYNGTKIFVSAGHAEQDIDAHCSDQKISLQAAGGRHSVPHTTVPLAVSPGPIGDLDNPNSYTNRIDESVLLPSDPSVLKDYPGLHVQDTVDPAVGSYVFGGGYGPRDDGNINPNPFSTDPTTTAPIMIAGIVLRDSSNGLIDYMTGLGGYRPTYDTMIRLGDSGSPLFGADGTYEGETVSIEIDSSSGEEIEKKYNVKLPAEAETQYFQIAHAQVVNTTTIAGLLADTRPCTTKPEQYVTVSPGTDISSLPEPTS